MLLRLLLLLVLLIDLHAQGLPERWHGRWSGQCTASRPGAADTTFAMQLHIAPLPEAKGWTWRIIYGEGERQQTRPYRLLPVAGKPGRFVIDEGNGVKLAAALVGDALYTRFKVGQSVLQATYRLDGDRLRFSLETFSAQGAGDKVESYPLLGVQRAALKKLP